MEHLEFSLISVFSEPKHTALGNVSAVVYTEKEVSRETMQLIANDLNQPATTFIYRQDGEWCMRWFAPDAEIQLCGHGTMAALALFHYGNKDIPTFRYSKGVVSGFVENGKIFSRLKKGIYTPSVAPEGLARALGVEIKDYFTTNDKDLVLIASSKMLKNMDPDFDALKKLKPFGYAVTAAGEDTDFVSRTLVPKVQQLEDHATGSSHTVLVPFWSDRLSKKQLSSKQLSRRGGVFECRLEGDHVLLGGHYRVLGNGILKNY
ncbi:MAG: PhzF family phenazine biosynthesis protein [Brumimicrobium sp.]|nr:PhzF family phenazine biosynthesis protein [Brumimicrobium sp.]